MKSFGDTALNILIMESKNSHELSNIRGVG